MSPCGPHVNTQPLPHWPHTGSESGTHPSAPGWCNALHPSDLQNSEYPGFILLYMILCIFCIQPYILHYTLHARFLQYALPIKFLSDFRGFSQWERFISKHKSPPPVQRVARDAGCKPLLPDSVSRRPRLSLRSSHYRT